jgi:hypothetical protein
MAETLYATKGYQSVIRWCDPTIDIDAYIVQRTANGTCKAGDFMGGEGETQGLVDQAVNTDAVAIHGVCLGYVSPPDNYDLDDTIVDGSTINILRPTGGRTMISVIMDGTTTTTYYLEEGDWVRIAGAGLVTKWLYTDGADETDSFSHVVGKAAETFSTASTTDRVICIWY